MSMPKETLTTLSLRSNGRNRSVEASMMVLPPSVLVDLTAKGHTNREVQIK